MSGRKSNYEWNYLTPFRWYRTVTASELASVVENAAIPSIDLTQSRMGRENAIILNWSQNFDTVAELTAVTLLTFELWGYYTPTIGTGGPAATNYCKWNRYLSLTPFDKLQGSYTFTGLPALSYKIIVSELDSGRTLHLFVANTI